MPKYPKLLSWRAKRYQVEDDQAKIAWGYTRLMALCLLAEEDYEFQNMQFEAKLVALGAINKILAQLAIMPEAEKYKLVNS